jgi:localization factor PodJL
MPLPVAPPVDTPDAQSSLGPPPINNLDGEYEPAPSIDDLQPDDGYNTLPAPNAQPQRAPPAGAPTPQASITPLDKLMSKAKAGDARAQLVLGLKYLDGDGVTASDSEAVRWLRRAAEQGDAIAQYRLGALYERGRGVGADPKQASYWYDQSAKRGNRKAMHNLAVAYSDGAGVAKNLGEAAKLFRQASDLGITDSQFNLAVLYERGMGVPASLTEAYLWYVIAANQGDAEAKARVEVLNTQIPAAERQAAEKTARSFTPKPMDRSANDPPTLAEVAP